MADNLPPGLRGYAAGILMNRQGDQANLGMLSGLMNLQNQSEQEPLRLGILRAQLGKAEADAALQKQATEALAGPGGQSLNPDQLEALGTRLSLASHPGGAGMVATAERLRQGQQQRAGQENFQQLVTQGGQFGPINPDAAVGGVYTQGGNNPAGVPDDVWKRMQAADAAGQPVDVRVPAPGNLIAQGAAAKVPGPVLAQFMPKPSPGFTLAPNATRYDPSGAPIATAPPAPAKAPIPQTTGGAPGDFTKTGDDFLQSIPESDRNFVKKLANYEIDPKTLSTRGGEREKFLRMAVQFDPNFDQKNYNSIATAVNRFATGPQGNTVRSLNVAIEHMDTARRLGDALKNGDIPAINQIANEFATQTGKPAPTRFDAVKEIVADEVIKGVIGGAGALQDREAAAKKIRATSSPAQLNGVLDSWTELLGGQLKGLEKQYEGATTRRDFRVRFLTPRALDAVGNGYSGPDRRQPASGFKVLGSE